MRNYAGTRQADTLSKSVHAKSILGAAIRIPVISSLSLLFYNYMINKRPINRHSQKACFILLHK